MAQAQTIEHNTTMETLAATPPQAQLPATTAETNAVTNDNGVYYEDGDDEMRVSLSKLDGALLNMLIDPATPLDRWDRVREYIDSMHKRRSELAYNRARARMIPHMPVISKSGEAEVRYDKKQGGEGKFTYGYMLSDEMIVKVQTVLGRFGFFWELKTTNDHDKKKVHCIGWLVHRDGHQSRPCEITLPYDTSGAKAEVQTAGSAQSYAEKYVLKALAVVAVGGDDDGNKTRRNFVEQASTQQRQPAQPKDQKALPDFAKPQNGNAYINKSQLNHLAELIGKAGGEAVGKKILEHYKIDSIMKLPADKYINVKANLEEKIKGTAANAQVGIKEQTATIPPENITTGHQGPIDEHGKPITAAHWKSLMLASIEVAKTGWDLRTLDLALRKPNEGRMSKDLWEEIYVAFTDRYNAINAADSGRRR